MSHHHNDPIAHILFFFGFGVWSFFSGFKKLRRKRKIENIPTSTVRGLAIGLVELIGRAEKKVNLISPFSQKECAYYKYKVERLQSSGKSSRWVTIARGDSSGSPFWLNDGTGKILVFPKGAETILPTSFRFESAIGRGFPGNLVAFMDKQRISYGGFLGNHRLRFFEWCMTDGVNAYVLGTAKSVNSQKYLEDYKDKLIQRLEEIKKNPIAMKEVDIDKDGKISNEEWDTAVSNIEQKLIEEEIARAYSMGEEFNTVINKGPDKEVFIISDFSQKDLTNKLGWQAFGGVFGGALIALFCLYLALLYFSGKLN